VRRNPGCWLALNLGTPTECLTSLHNFTAQHNFVAHHRKYLAWLNFVAQYNFVAEYNNMTACFFKTYTWAFFVKARKMGLKSDYHKK